MDRETEMIERQRDGREMGETEMIERQRERDGRENKLESVAKMLK